MNKVKKGFLSICMLSGLALVFGTPTDVPQVDIENGLIRLRLYLPDAQNGYYRGTRFDWSGVIPSLEYQGHQYHGKWFDRYDPTNHDAIMGPVEEFGPLGYTEAKTGESFVKIGVGSLVKPDEQAYNAFRPYTISNPGKRNIRKERNNVQFTHILQEGAYAYTYKKTVELAEGKPEMAIMHSLKNTGRKTIETTVYDHNFFMIDTRQTGPGYEISFPYDSLSAAGAKGLGEVIELQEGKISFLRNLTGKEQGYFPDLTNGASKPYTYQVQNLKTGAGVNVSCDRPVSKMVFWSNPATVCPEPYIDVKVAPGETFTWNITYKYYIHKP